MATTTDLTTDKDYLRAGMPIAIRRQEVVVDFATLLVTHDSAIIAADTFQLLKLPANSIIWGGGVEVIEVCNSGATVCLFDVGIAAADEVVNNGDGEVLGHFFAGTNAGGFADVFDVLVDDTLDLTFKTVTGTLTTGLIRIYIMISDGAGLSSLVT